MEPPIKKARWTRAEKVLLTVSLAVAVLAGMGIFWWQTANANPEVTIPTPTLPNPNAHDFFVAAGKTLVHDREVGMAAVGRRRGRNPKEPAFTLAEKQKLVRDNAQTLRTLREGFAYPYHEPPARSFAHLFPHYATFRSMARLLILEGQVKEARGDRGGAANSYVDAMYMGKEIPRGGNLIGALVGYACEAIGRRPLWDLADRLSAVEARAAARRMEKLTQRRVPFADTLQEEKWTGQAGLMAMNPFGFIGGMVHGGGNARGQAGAAPRARLLFKGKRRIIRDHARFMDQITANARQPYAAHLPDPPLPDDAINRMLLPVFSQARIKAVDTETQDALLTVVFALRAYRAERGNYPASLKELVPAYLSRIPPDPFALQGSLRYKRTGEKYLLYSVGPDGRDDGGKPIRNPDRRGQEQRWAEAGTIGDYVVGVNTY